MEENTPPGNPSKKWVVVGVILVILVPYLGLLPYAKYLGFDITLPEMRNISFLVSRILLWLLLGGFVLYARKVERSRFLLWQEKQYELGIYIAFSLVTFVAIVIGVVALSVVLRLLHLYNENNVLQRLAQLFNGNIALTVFTCITAGVTEELMFRGYLQPRLELLSGNKIVAIAGSALFFALLHFGFGTVQNIIGPFVIGIIFAVHYSLFRNIRFLVVFHVLWDLIILSLVMQYVQK